MRPKSSFAAPFTKGETTPAILACSPLAAVPRTGTAIPATATSRLMAHHYREEVAVCHIISSASIRGSLDFCGFLQAATKHHSRKLMMFILSTRVASELLP
jgi:hypothetical protein